jgi:hypothetical protein
MCWSAKIQVHPKTLKKVPLAWDFGMLTKDALMKVPLHDKGTQGALRVDCECVAEQTCSYFTPPFTNL